MKTQFKVYHFSGTGFSPRTIVEANAVRTQYHRVAIVETDNLDMVFELTNHSFRSWQENEEIVRSVPKARSTSVGDIIKNLGSGRCYLVAPMGFDPITLLNYQLS